MPDYKGMLHVHSLFSYDAVSSLLQIKLLAQEKGVRFLCMTEHTDRLQEKQFLEMVKSCHELSSSQCLLIPGLEFTCEDGAHLLALGLEKWVEARKLVEIVSRANDSGAVFILAHPSDGKLKKLLDSNGFHEHLHGIEVWNRKYNGSITPKLKSLSVLKQVRGLKSNFFAYAGVDFHDAEDEFTPLVILKASELSKSAVLSALKSGDFAIKGKFFSVPSHGVLNDASWIRAVVYSAIRFSIFNVLKWIKRNLLSSFTALNNKPKLEKKLRRYL